MDVQLTPDLERLIERRVEAGEFSDASDAIRRSLELMFALELPNDEERERIRVAVQVGVEELDRGDFADGKQFLAELDAEFETFRKL